MHYEYGVYFKVTDVTTYSIECYFHHLVYDIGRPVGVLRDVISASMGEELQTIMEKFSNE